jgi:hypothetical protein
MQDGDNGVQLGYERLQMFIDHGIRVLVLGGNRVKIRETHLDSIDPAYPWDDAVRFLPHLKGIHFDNVVDCQPGPRWRGFQIKQIGNFEKLTTEDLRLVARAFQKAEEVHLRKISDGFTSSRVFMAMRSGSKLRPRLLTGHSPACSRLVTVLPCRRKWVQ